MHIKKKKREKKIYWIREKQPKDNPPKEAQPCSAGFAEAEFYRLAEGWLSSGVRRCLARPLLSVMRNKQILPQVQNMEMLRSAPGN